MSERGFIEAKSGLSPTGLTIVILLHGAAITALAMSKMEMPEMVKYLPIEVENIPIPSDPPEIPPEPVKDQKPVPRETQLDYVPPKVPTIPQGPVILHDPTLDPPVYDPTPPMPKAEPRPDPVPPQPPVRVAAQMRSGDLQPPYPRALEAAQIEGKVSVRLTIGADGRVKSVEKVSATHDAFFEATERHALRAWRFKPATADGKPVESRQVIGVEFRLNG